MTMPMTLRMTTILTTMTRFSWTPRWWPKRHAPARGPPGKDARTKTQPHVRKIPKDGPFSPSEQEEVNQSWHAIMDHMDGDVVLAAPDFEDPLAHFVICTDASDYAVGGVLMQWQHEASRGPGPPAGVDPRSSGKDSLGRDVDPLDNKWRLEAGWKLKKSKPKGSKVA